MGMHYEEGLLGEVLHQWVSDARECAVVLFHRLSHLVKPRARELWGAHTWKPCFGAMKAAEWQAHAWPEDRLYKIDRS
jgi:hypothetical protein